jgi:hypothetical protein
MGQDERMKRAYRVSGQALLEDLRERRPDDARVLEGVRPTEVAAIRGSYDHCEQVLEATRVPFAVATPQEAARIDWERLEVLLVEMPLLPRLRSTASAPGRVAATCSRPTGRSPSSSRCSTRSEPRHRQTSTAGAGRERLDDDPARRLPRGRIAVVLEGASYR